MPSTDLLESTRKYLNSFNISVKEAWLTQCLEYFLESLSEINISSIQNNVKEQYYLNDLRDSCDGCLPQNLKLKKEITLPNKYVLQINSIIDIGKPAFQQYMELKKVDLQNIEATKKYEEKIPTCRMLKLNMTDGVQDIVGIEYRTIKCLHVNIPPGFKMLVKGPVKCRNGMLLLEERNCELLDGEVDELKETNSQLAILQRQLELFDFDKMRALTLSSQTSSEMDLTTPCITPESMPSSSGIQTNSTDSYKTTPSTSKEQPTFSTESSSTTFSGRQELEDDFQDMDMEIDTRELDKIEAEFSGKVNRPDDIVLPPEKKMKTDRNDEFPDDDDDLMMLNSFNEERFSDVDESDVFNDKQEVIINIKDMNLMKDKAFKSFKVKAKIDHILTKLSVTKEVWRLSCSITDGTDSVDVSFSNEVLQKVIGYSPQQMYQLRKLFEKRPEMKEKGTLIISEAKEKFKNLNCKMKLQFESDNVPTVTELIDYY